MTEREGLGDDDCTNTGRAVVDGRVTTPTGRRGSAIEVLRRAPRAVVTGAWGIITLALAPGLAAQDSPGEVVGCYTLELDEWIPRSFVEAYPRLATVPRTLELTERRRPVPGIPVAFSASSDETGSGVRFRAWWAAAGDSAVVVSSTVFVSGIYLVMAREGEELAGRAHAFVQGPDRPSPYLPIEADAGVRANPVACPGGEAPPARARR